MMMQEFEQRTGFFPTLAMYEVVERAYSAFDGDKDAFCEAYKANADGLAEWVQREANMSDLMVKTEHAAEIAHRDAENKRLKKKLEREQEWKPYDMPPNVSPEQYAKLAERVSNGGAHYMTDDEALDWVCGEFGFDRSQVTILHEVDEYEINRHNQLRQTGRKLDRRPIYCAADYHYIRFNTGSGEWQWEAWDGKMQPFFD